MSLLSVNFLGAPLKSPLVLASGIWGSSVTLLERAARNGCGAVTAKSCGPHPRTGHVNPSCIDWEHGLINAIGLANPGVDAEIGLLTSARDALAPHGVPLIASIFAGTPAEFAEVASKIASAGPSFIELNVSCPNVGSEFGEPFAGSPEAAAAVTREVKQALATTEIPVIVKLAPNVPSVAKIARAVVEAGADALCAVNTMPGMLIDAECGQPVLANRSGGISGPALKPIGLRCVYEVYSACPGVPIIGTGGVSSGVDVIEYIMAGATAVGVGSAIYYRGEQAIRNIAGEIEDWLVAHGAQDLRSLHGIAHADPTFPVSPSHPPVPAAH
jgi:dihydroorotate dehydrogenase (NAD+) catalytic subunit